MSIDDYVLVKVIGRGAFGEVRLCRSKADPEQLYAIKVLKKKEMRQKDQVAHVRAERDLMRSASTNRWVVTLFYRCVLLSLLVAVMPVDMSTRIRSTKQHL